MKYAQKWLHLLSRNQGSFRDYSEAAITPLSSDTRCLGARLVSVAIESDPTATKVSLLVYSSVMSAAFWINGPSCALRLCDMLDKMTGWLGGWPAWGVLWTLYSVLTLWRLLEAKARPKVAMAINILGAVMFSVTAIAAILARWPDFIISAPYISLSAAAIWVAARTGINPGRGFRGD